MRYSLWGHGRLLGHTDLDIPHVQENFLLGFVEPTAEGVKWLPDATGVARLTGRSVSRDRGEMTKTEMADFMAACDRREALKLELRDENGAVLPAEWITVWDLKDHELEKMIQDELEDDEPLDPDEEAEMEREIEEILQEWREEAQIGAGWPPPERDDPRWETMQYHIQVMMKHDHEDGILGRPWRGE